jgi:hypothetical protein
MMICKIGEDVAELEIYESLKEPCVCHNFFLWVFLTVVTGCGAASKLIWILLLLMKTNGYNYF